MNSYRNEYFDPKFQVNLKRDHLFKELFESSGIFCLSLRTYILFIFAYQKSVSKVAANEQVFGKVLDKNVRSADGQLLNSCSIA